MENEETSMRNIKSELINEHGPYCWCCNNMFDPEDLEGHHMQLKSCGGKNTKDNIAILCHECHFKLHGYTNNHKWNKYNKAIKSVKYNATLLKQNWQEFVSTCPIMVKKDGILAK